MALLFLTAWNDPVAADGVNWQVRRGEEVQVVAVRWPRIYRICLYSEMFAMQSTFEPEVRTLDAVHQLKLASPPNTVRCIDIEAKTITIVGGGDASGSDDVAFGTYELVP